MGKLLIQGFISPEGGIPLIKFCQVDDAGNMIASWKVSPTDARMIARIIYETSIHTVHSAALIAWAADFWLNDELIHERILDLTVDLTQERCIDIQASQREN